MLINLNLFAQDWYASPFSLKWGASATPRILNIDSFTVNRFMLGFQWSGTAKMRNALKMNSYSGNLGFYLDSTSDEQVDLINNILYYNHGPYISAYKIDTQSSITNDETKNIFNIPSNSNAETLQINFQLSNNYFVNMRIYNSNGKLINEIENKNYTFGIYSQNYNIQNLPNGAYYVLIKLNNMIYS